MPSAESIRSPNRGAFCREWQTQSGHYRRWTLWTSTSSDVRTTSLAFWSASSFWPNSTPSFASSSLIAATRARELLVLPRLDAAQSKSAWISLVDLSLAELPAQIRGFGPVKAANAAVAATRRAELLAVFRAGPATQKTAAE